MATQFINEGFSGTEGQSLQDYSASWVTGTGSVGTVNIVTGRARNSAQTNALYRHTTAPPQADYSVTGTIIFNIAGTAYGGVCARLSSAAATFYMARYATQEGQVQLYKFVAGAATLLGSKASVLTVGTPRTLRLEVIGSAINVYEGGSATAAISATDSAITSAGFAGIRLNGAFLDLDSLVAEYEASSTTTLTASAVTQAIQATSGAVQSAHSLSASNVLLASVSSSNAVVQQHNLAGNTSVQYIQTVSGSITQNIVLLGSPVAGPNQASTGLVAQTHTLGGSASVESILASSGAMQQQQLLAGVSAAVETLSTVAGILQSHLLLGSASLQPNYSSAGGVSFVDPTVLNGVGVEQTLLSSVGGVVQEHKLGVDASEQPTTSLNAQLVQTHVLVSNNALQLVLSTSGTIAVEEAGSLQGNSAKQDLVSNSGFVIQAHALQGSSVKEVSLSSTGAITQSGVLPPLTDAEIRQMFAMLQVAVAKLQTRIDAVL